MDQFKGGRSHSLPCAIVIPSKVWIFSLSLNFERWDKRNIDNKIRGTLDRFTVCLKRLNALVCCFCGFAYPFDDSVKWGKALTN